MTNDPISLYKEEASRIIKFNFTDFEAKAKELRPSCPDGSFIISSDPIRDEDDRDIISGLLELDSRIIYASYKSHITESLPQDRVVFIEQDSFPLYDILKCDMYIYLHNWDMVYYAMLSKRLCIAANPKDCYPKPVRDIINGAWNEANVDKWAYCYGEEVRNTNNFEEFYRCVFHDALSGDDLNILINSEKTGIGKFHELVKLMIDNREFFRIWTNGARLSLSYETNKAYREKQKYDQAHIGTDFLNVLSGDFNAKNK